MSYDSGVGVADLIPHMQLRTINIVTISFPCIPVYRQVAALLLLVYCHTSMLLQQLDKVQCVSYH